MPENQLKNKEAQGEKSESVEQAFITPEMPKNLEQAKENLIESQAKEVANVEIREVKDRTGRTGDEVKKEDIEEVETNKEEEKLKEDVKNFFREIILNSKDPERKEIEAALRRIASENEVKFDEIIDESYKLRDEIVKMIQQKEFDVAIVGKIEGWLLLIFPAAKSKLFCKQAAFRLAMEVKEHWKL